jgi:hypothetical protein
MENRNAVFEVWKLVLLTVVALVLLIDLHVMFRSISSSADKFAESYVKQSDSVTNSAEQLTNVLFPPDSRKDYQRLASRAHHVLLRQMEDSLNRAEAESARPMLNR